MPFKSSTQSLASEQPAPVSTSTSQAIWPCLKDFISSSDLFQKDRNEIISFLDSRVQKGLEHYGTLLKTNNGRNPVIDALQEASDLLFYLKQYELEVQDSHKKFVASKAISLASILFVDLFSLSLAEAPKMTLSIDKSRKSPNFSKGRKAALDTLVIHDTEGDNIEKTLKWFESKDSSVSAHYIIGKDGQVFQMVEDEDTAWHCGKSCLPSSSKEVGNTVNHRSIGIELVNIGDGKHEFPQKQMDALVLLVNDLKTRHEIKHIVGHKEIAPGRKNDPADNFDWSQIR